VVTTYTAKRTAPDIYRLVGLDGLFAKVLRTYGINAAKGRWINEHHLRWNADFGTGETQTWALTSTATK